VTGHIAHVVNRETDLPQGLFFLENWIIRDNSEAFITCIWCEQNMQIKINDLLIAMHYKSNCETKWHMWYIYRALTFFYCHYGLWLRTKGWTSTDESMHYPTKITLYHVIKCVCSMLADCSMAWLLKLSNGIIFAR
jgi:hypothetical protein